MHSWTGYVDYPMLAGPVTKFTECDIESMRAPLWRFGKDWKNPKDPYEDEELELYSSDSEHEEMYQNVEETMPASDS